MSHRSYQGRLAAILVCLVTALAVSACGGQSVSSQVKTKLNSELVSAMGLSSSKAQALTNCLVPVLASHHIYTLSDAKAITTTPAWLNTGIASCSKQLGISGS